MAYRGTDRGSREGIVPLSHRPGDLLRLIRTGEATTRGELQHATGLSRVTVSRRLDTLQAAGIIREGGIGSATGGRRPGTFMFDPDVVVLVATLDAVGGTTAAVNAKGEVLARGIIDARVADGPEKTLATVAIALRKLAVDNTIPLERAVAVAISVPGPTNPVDQRLDDPPIMPGWSGWPIVEFLREEFGMPVYVENDADAMAYGEAFHSVDPSKSMVLVKVSAYIGAGIVLDGQIFRGTDGGAGDLGHVKVGGTTPCRCGKTGCLAAEASGMAVARRLRDAGVDLDEPDDIVALAESGNAIAAGELQRAGELIGTVVATVVGIINPAVIVIAGSLACTPLVAAIRSSVYAQSLPRATRHLEIRTSTFSADAAAIGLATLAVNDHYSARNVNLRLDADA